MSTHSHHRPISPHLSIYRKQITSVLSILHRLTGIALYAGMAVLVTWLYIAAYAPAAYEDFHGCMNSMVGQFFLFGWTAAFYYHLANGIRHLFWDIGKGYTLPQVNASGWMVIIFTLGMTFATWGFIHSAGSL